MALFSSFEQGVFPSLLNVTRQLDPDGNSASIVELLQQTNAPLLDMPWGEGNLSNGERTTVRTGLPSAIWRQFYQGVPSSRSEFAQITDSCGMLETRSEVDKDLADLNGNTQSFRLNESYAFIEAMNQNFMQALLYGNASVNPQQFNGLSPRFGAMHDSSNNLLPIAQNIIDAGGTGSNLTSIWLVCWGVNSIYGIFPKGKKGGLQHQDLGEYDAFDVNQARFRVYGDHWKWDCGLTVKDWRYIVRIANIDVSKLVAGTGPDIITLLVKALHRVPNLGIVQTGVENVSANGARPIPLAPNPVFYANRTIHEFIDIQSLSKTQYTLKSGNDAFGRPVTFVRGIPLRTCDQILSTETQVV